MAKATAKRDIAYDKITAQIITALESGIVPWKKPWNIAGGLMPQNVASKKVYNGLNVLLLGCQDHASHVWGTFKQWKEKGGMVRKGEKGTSIIFWTFFPKKINGNVVLDAKGRPEKIPFLKYYTVFNAEQIDDIELSDYMPEKVETPEFSPIEAAEKVVSEMPNRPVIEHGGSNAGYSPSLDRVRMPQKEDFHGNGEYYSILFHELGHSTGHSSRVGRDLSPTSFGSESYSKEELVAEIAACFLCSSVGIEQTFDNSAAYLKGWLKRLKDDNKLIVRAASQARKASAYILNETAKEKEVEAVKEAVKEA